MHLDKKFLQRALLAFTTGLFLACAARVSAAQSTHRVIPNAATVIPSAARDLQSTHPVITSEASDLQLSHRRSMPSEIATAAASPSVQP